MVWVESGGSRVVLTPTRIGQWVESVNEVFCDNTTAAVPAVLSQQVLPPIVKNNTSLTFYTHPVPITSPDPLSSREGLACETISPVPFCHAKAKVGSLAPLRARVRGPCTYARPIPFARSLRIPRNNGSYHYPRTQLATYCRHYNNIYALSRLHSSVVKTQVSYRFEM